MRPKWVQILPRLLLYAEKVNSCRYFKTLQECNINTINGAFKKNVPFLYICHNRGGEYSHNEQSYFVLRSICYIFVGV